MRPASRATKEPTSGRAAEGQKAAQALSEAYEAVADFVKPSVVQISVQRKAGALNPRRGNPRAPVPNVPTRGNDCCSSRSRTSRSTARLAGVPSSSSVDRPFNDPSTAAAAYCSSIGRDE